MRGFRDLSDAWSARLQRAIPEAYERVIDAALAAQVDFVVLAGDAFDTSQASYCDYLLFFEGLKKLGDAGIEVYLIPGNHDPLTTWQQSIPRLPENAHMLGIDAPEFALFERDGEPLCLIGARGYRSQSWPVGESISDGITRSAAIEATASANPHAEQAPFCIGIIHAGFEQDQAKARANPEALIAADVDYWACGHLHKRLTLPSLKEPKVVFPGCVQGRDLKESGERGCWLVTMENEREMKGKAGDARLTEPPNGVQSAETLPSPIPLKRSGTSRTRISLDFIPTASIAFHTVNVNVSSCQTLADVARLVQARLFHVNAKANCDEMVVRVELSGATDLHAFLAQPGVLFDLRKRINDTYPMFFCDALVDRTHPPRNKEAMLREGLFEAHVLRVSDQQRTLPEEMVNFVQAEFVRRGVDVPSSLVSKMDKFSNAAEELVLDLLAAESQAESGR